MLRIAGRLWELLFPEKCVLCRRILSREELDLCHTCRAEAPEYDRRRPKLRYIRDFTAVWYYEDQVRSSLLRFKFGGVRSYCESYGRLLAMRVRQELPEDIDLVTWVPIGPKRRRKRGYDQVELIARVVSRELELPLARLLDKPKDNPAQSGLKGPEERRANVLGVYRVTDRETIKEKNILLLDDIVTTGATAAECGKTLQLAGAKYIYCAAVAAVRQSK